MSNKIVQGDCLDVMKRLPDSCVDAIVCDPPAGIAFMGKDWDRDKGGRDAWVAWMASIAREALRVIKPGGHALVWALPRTSHWTGWAWEDGGWEPRDKIVHLFGSGFPKSLDVSKAIDKAAGMEREVVGRKPIAYPDSDCWGTPNRNVVSDFKGWKHTSTRQQDEPGMGRVITAPATEAAKQWQGWGTALKPASEDWWLFRKPLQGTVGTVAANVLAHGTGAINVDACRIGETKRVPGSPKRAAASAHTVSLPGYGGGSGHDPNVGRWPANVTLGCACESEAHDEGCAVRMLDEQSGGASRFFYTAKASRRERGEGNVHPCVKPIALMRWLVRMVTPKGGNVLDPFAGSGTTLLAAHLEGFDYLGIEREAEYVEIIRKRLARVEDLR